MKKCLAHFCMFAWLLCGFCFFGCTKTKPVVIEGDVFLIAVDTDNIAEGGTLKDYMDYMQSEGQCTYSISNGMITSINGKTGATNQYWMVYTNDIDPTWVDVSHQGLYQDKLYNSASWGAETLVVKDGCTYIWFLQTF